MSSMKNMHPGSPPDPSWTTAERGEAELRILNFKTTWSKFQKPSQAAATSRNRATYTQF